MAVVGAGIAGSACTWRLLAGRGALNKCSVTVFEMGRGAGGRAGTRHVRNWRGLPDLHVNHGAPMFHVPTADERTKPLVAALLASGHLAEWEGTFGRVDASTGEQSPCEGSRGESRVEGSFLRYKGTPEMSAVAGGCLELAANAEPDSLDIQFETRLKEFRPKKVSGSIVGWELFDKTGANLGEFDWVIVSGITPALARWRNNFKEEPPVLAAAKASGSARLQGLIESLDQPMPYEELHVAMLAWEDPHGDVAKILRERLPFDVTHVTGDASLAKVVVQSLGPPFVIVTLHSTEAFFTRHSNVMGAGSWVSVSNNVLGSISHELFAAQELQVSFDRVLKHKAKKRGSSVPPPATWGPELHRWGAAFPSGDLPDPLSADEACLLHEERFGLAGDFLSPPGACVAASMRSGLAVAESLLRHMD